MSALMLAVAAAILPGESDPAAPAIQAGAPAAPPRATPTAAPLPAGTQQKLQALVIAVEGRSEWRNAGVAAWKLAAVNDLLDPGCEIRTGLRSTLALRVGKDATLLVDRSSRVELPLIVQDGAVLRTRAAVWRGKCDFKVDAVGVASDFQVLTPSATLAVRGTGFSVLWGALAGLEVKSADANRIHALEVRWLLSNETVLLSGGNRSTEARHDPVEDALFRTVFPPPWPDRFVGDYGQDPVKLPPPALYDIHRQQQIDHGTSDFGRDTRTGQGTPGVPPIHG